MTEQPRRPIWRVEQYEGDADITVTPTQLMSDRGVTASVQKTVLAEWIEFFRRGPSPIEKLFLASRVTQPIVDSLAGQAQLGALGLKWGPYDDLRPLATLRNLTSLTLGGAKKVVDLTPLVELTALRELRLDEPDRVADFTPLSDLTRLTSLSLGNGYPGSDRTIDLGRIDWLGNLRSLTALSLPGSTMDAGSLDVIATLPALRELGLPLRRTYRARVFALAEQSQPFADVAQKYLDYDAYRAAIKAR